MLIHKLDMDRAFDLTIKKTHPYLIFSSDELKLTLSGMLSSLYQYYSEGNDIKFDQLNKEIEKTIDETHLDSNTDITSFNFKYQQMTLDQAQKEINKRIIKTEEFLEEFEGVKVRLKKLEAVLKNEKIVGKLKHEFKTESVEKITVNVESEIPKTCPQVSNTCSDVFDTSSKCINEPTNVEIVIECIKRSDVPQSIKEIATVTGLKNKQVSMAIINIKKSHSDVLKNITFGTREQDEKGKPKIKINTILWNPIFETAHQQIKTENTHAI